MSIALHRNSTRLRDFDYASSGAYFVTICAAQRAHLFGEILEGQTVLNDFGRIALECWNAIPDYFPNVFIDEFAIMPNHLHGIVCIDLPTVGALCLAHMGVTHASPLRREDDILREGRRELAVSKDKSIQPVRNGVSAQSLGAIIGSFKATVTKRARATSSNPDLHVWQRGYHDHVVRDEADLERIRMYISANPITWHSDEYAVAA